MSIDWAQIALGAVGAGAGTWFGAWAAFRHERVYREARDHREEGERLKQVLFVLLTQRTTLVNMRDQALAPYEKKPLRHLAMPPYLVALDDVRLDFERLMFVLNTADADLLNRLHITNRCVGTVLSAIELRNKLHLTGQDLMAKEQAGGRKGATEAELREIVGPQRWAHLLEFTNTLYEMVPRALKELAENYDAVELIVRARYPEVKLFKVQYLPGAEPTPGK